MKTRHFIWTAVISLVLNSPALAVMGATPDEMAMLPPYCDAKMGSRNPESASYWRNQMGHDNWLHIHHYCGGLLELNRYYRSSTGLKTPNLRNAVNQFNGMLNAFTPDFYLRPEVHLNRGRVLKFMGKEGEAIHDFQKALELDARLAPARIELANLYVKSGKKEQALDVLKKGLELSPSTKNLRRRYQELGGDPKALPETTAPAAEPAIPRQADAAPAVQSAGQAAPGDATKQVEPAAPAPAPKIGNKTNPWCRFCPDPASETPQTND